MSVMLAVGAPALPTSAAAQAVALPTNAAAQAAAQWPFVIAAYAVGVSAVLALLLWSWLAMRRAEKRRDAVLGRKR